MLGPFFQILDSINAKNQAQALGLAVVIEALNRRGRDPQISDLPEGKARDVLGLIESLLPVNHWEIKGKLDVALGHYEKDVRVLSFGEKVKETAREAGKNPNVVIAANRAKKAAAIEAGKASLDALGINLDEVVGDVAKFFGLDPPEAELNQKMEDMKADTVAPLTDEEMGALDRAMPAFKNTAVARMAVATANTRVPVKFYWSGQGLASAKLTYWRWESGNHHAGRAQTVDLLLKPENVKKKGLAEFEAVVPLGVGRWAYFWEANGERYYDMGKLAPKDDGLGYYQVLEVTCIEPIYD